LTAGLELQRYCRDIVREHAYNHGWSKRQTNDVIRSLRLLQTLQPTPGSKIRATDVEQLPRYRGRQAGRWRAALTWSRCEDVAS
jgi:hypothetical protein